MTNQNTFENIVFSFFSFDSLFVLESTNLVFSWLSQLNMHLGKMALAKHLQAVFGNVT